MQKLRKLGEIVKNKIKAYFANRTRKNWITLTILVIISPVVFAVVYTLAAYVLFDPADLIFVTQAGEKIIERDGIVKVRYLGDPANVISVEFDQIPKYCVDGIIAAEDKSFFENPGYDFAGLVRGIYDEFADANFGGSSITHQVIKIGTARYFSRNFSDKFHEVVFGLKLNNALSKQKILEIYLNNVYLGNFNYGIGAAARNYFGKDVTDLSLAECSYLVGLPQQPSVYHPYARVDLGVRRQYIVLNFMLQQRSINQEQFKQAINEELVFLPRHTLLDDLSGLQAGETAVNIYYHRSPESRELVPLEVSTERLDIATFTLEQYFNPTSQIIGFYAPKGEFVGDSNCDGKDFEITNIEKGLAVVKLCRDRTYPSQHVREITEKGIETNLTQFETIRQVEIKPRI